MDSLDKALSKIFSLVEKYALILVAVAGFLLYKKFGKLLGLGEDAEKEQAAAEQAATEHNTALQPAKKKPLPADPKQRDKVIAENIKAADAHLVATVAEEINKYTGEWNFQLVSTKVAALNKIADQMKRYKASYTRVAAEYKKIDGDDLTKDLRYVLKDDYSTWLRRASF